jgi:hypothetical protein
MGRSGTGGNINTYPLLVVALSAISHASTVNWWCQTMIVAMGQISAKH